MFAEYKHRREINDVLKSTSPNDKKLLELILFEEKFETYLNQFLGIYAVEEWRILSRSNIIDIINEAEKAKVLQSDDNLETKKEANKKIRSMTETQRKAEFKEIVDKMIDDSKKIIKSIIKKKEGESDADWEKRIKDHVYNFHFYLAKNKDKVIKRKKTDIEGAILEKKEGEPKKMTFWDQVKGSSSIEQIFAITAINEITETAREAKDGIQKIINFIKPKKKPKRKSRRSRRRK